MSHEELLRNTKKEQVLANLLVVVLSRDCLKETEEDEEEEEEKVKEKITQGTSPWLQEGWDTGHE
ncbi:hypothetical protein E2C01_051928 [Portunus trituberculatus]|uniref:Uncharacterized protein n=1 Tax=Portunus trituberculatus TaxID=210409 RepID=A0A5B7GK65_PORTR|nr:hypothetical protein [Portunus trituberculatus]